MQRSLLFLVLRRWGREMHRFGFIQPRENELLNPLRSSVNTAKFPQNLTRLLKDFAFNWKWYPQFPFQDSLANINLDCKTVRIFACSSTREQSNKRSATRLTSLTCEARALRVRKTLTPRFTDFFTDFEKKTDINQHLKPCVLDLCDLFFTSDIEKLLCVIPHETSRICIYPILHPRSETSNQYCFGRWQGIRLRDT